MANLLDRASVVLTPTAYNNGEVLCVKPDDASGDFQFSRNSAATRVNAQGLVEDVQILSSNLVQNGSFSQLGSEEVTNGSFTNGSTDWNLGTGWSIGDNKASQDGSATSFIFQNNILVSGKTYKVQYTISDYVSGNVRFSAAGVQGSVNGSNGVVTDFIKVNSAKFALQGLNSFIGSVTNISVKEVGQNWEFPNDWEVGNNKIIGLGSGFGGLQQTISLQNKKIKVPFDILDYVSGTFRVPPTYRQDGLDERFSGNGSYEVIYTSLVDFFSFQPQLFDGSITNISAIEITDDTNLPRISYENFSYQDALGSEQVTNGGFSSDLSGWSSITNVSWSSNFGGSAFMNANGTNAQFRQFITYVVGKTYRISWEVKENNGCDLFRVYNNGGFTNITDNFVGTHTIDFTQTSGTLFLLRNDTIGSNITIDNVSVKEVTGQEVVPDSGCGSWLFEPQSTNLITYSEDFSQWGTVGSPTITSNFGISPDGTQNSTRLQFSTSDRIFINVSASGNITFSVYLKGVGQVRLRDNDGSNTKDITLTSEWVRYEFIFNDTITNIQLQQSIGTSDFEIWGAQVEEQTYATSYIPTDGTSVTRNQDVCTNGGTGTGLINSTEGVLYAEIAALADDLTNRMIALSDSNTTDHVRIYYTTSTNKISVAIKSNGLNQYVFLNHNVTDITNYIKIAVKYKANDFATFINGVKVNSQTTTASAPIGLDRLNFDNGVGSNKFFGKTKALAVWKEALTDTELQELTTI